MNGREGRGINSGNYQQTWEISCGTFNGPACGVNQIVFHGYSYEGYYDGEENEKRLPARRPLAQVHHHGLRSVFQQLERLPAHWIHVKRFTDFLARHQMVLRARAWGKNRPGYIQAQLHGDNRLHGRNKIYEDGGLLEQTGYSYDFISPSA